ncbi:MAG TPA: DUF3943 domain-containing protein [Ferruginibacter sp.]|nr:DUF3943 domain-containing protein [Ferruginibacter sp.]HMP22263.1 DUF3943 domain-containing protein [Ferruginibacter sp.]
MLNKYLAISKHFRLVSFFFLVGAICYTQSTAQVLQAYNVNTMRILLDSNKSYPVDTVPQQKRFWQAGGQLMLAQVIPWSFNKFVRKAEFANISFNSIWHNMQFKNWRWDDNNFNTNQFAHPYHGNLYFNAFRTNGYNFWASSAAAIGGSYIWETCGETHPAAPNDLINTSLGGIALGEMTYRLANRIINNRKKGAGRRLQEITGFLINPMNGFTRITTGKWGKVYDADPYENAPLAFMVDAGSRRVGLRVKDFIDRGENEWYTRLRLLYGDPFKDMNKPFSNFSVSAELGNDDSSRLNSLLVSGNLYGKRLRSASPAVKNYFSITMHYDYYKNERLNFGAQSFAANLFSNRKLGLKSELQLSAGAGIVALAAVPNKYVYFGEGRNYDYGPGFTYAGSAGLTVSDKLFCTANYRGAWFKTIDGEQSNYYLHTSSFEARYALSKYFSAGVEGGLFQLIGKYRDFDDVNDEYPFVRVFVGYRIVF